MKKRTVGILGAIGYDDYGDDALLLCNIEELLKRNYHIIIFSYNPAKTTNLLISNGILPLNAVSDNIDVVNDLNFYVDNVKCIYYLNIILNFGFDAIKTIYYQYLLRKINRSMPSLESSNTILSNYLYNISKCSCILNMGGGYLNSYLKANIYSHILTHSIADKLGIPIIAYGQTFGPFSEFQKYLISTHIKKISHISVRDFGRSKLRLKEMGFPESRISEGPDDAIFLNYNNAKCDILKQFDGKFVIITNFGLFLNYSKMPLNCMYLVFAKFFDYLIENKNAIIVNISMTSSGKDVEQGLAIQQRMKNKQFFFHLPLYVGVREIKSIIKDADFIFSSRLHPIVFAISEKKPYIGISSGGEYYDSKLIGISEIYGYNPEHHIINADNMTFDLLLQYFNNALEDSYIGRDEIYLLNELKRKNDLDNIANIIQKNC